MRGAARSPHTNSGKKTSLLSIYEHTEPPPPLPSSKTTKHNQQDGAKAVIHAATCDWDADRPAAAAAKKGAKGKPSPASDLRYYARGVFTWPQITSDWALGGRGALGKLKGDLWGLSTVVLSFLDWPLRRAAPGLACLSKARACKPGSHAYDEKVAAELWDVSAEYAGLPAAPQL